MSSTRSTRSTRSETARVSALARRSLGRGGGSSRGCRLHCSRGRAPSADRPQPPESVHASPDRHGAKRNVGAKGCGKVLAVRLPQRTHQRVTPPGAELVVSMSLPAIETPPVVVLGTAPTFLAVRDFSLNYYVL